MGVWEGRRKRKRGKRRGKEGFTWAESSLNLANSRIGFFSSTWLVMCWRMIFFLFFSFFFSFSFSSTGLVLCWRMFFFSFICRVLKIVRCAFREELGMGWLRVVGSLKLQVSFAKEPCKRDYILQKKPITLRSLQIVATPYLREWGTD